PPPAPSASRGLRISTGFWTKNTRSSKSRSRAGHAGSPRRRSEPYKPQQVQDIPAGEAEPKPAEEPAASQQSEPAQPADMPPLAHWRANLPPPHASRCPP